MRLLIGKFKFTFHLPLRPYRNVSSVGLEHYFDRVGVTGSSPVRSTTLTTFFQN